MENILKWIAIVIVFLFMLFLGGCAKDIIYVEVENNKIELLTNEIQQLNLKPFEVVEIHYDNINYTCINKTNLSEVIKMFQEIKVHIKEQKDKIEYYEEQIKIRNTSQ